MSDAKVLRQYLSQLLLLVQLDKFEVAAGDDLYDSAINPIKMILSGESTSLLSNPEYSSLIFTEASTSILQKYPGRSLPDVISEFLEEVSTNFITFFKSPELAKLHLHFIAIALLQSFIQVNYTGPTTSVSSGELFFPNVDSAILQLDSINCISIEGQQAYDLIIDPLFLILSLILFEKLLDIPHGHSLISWNPNVTLEQLSDVTSKQVEVDLSSNPLQASIQWWRARAIQVHLSVLSEPSDILSTISTILLNSSVPNALAPAIDQNVQIQKHVQLIYFLECARSGLQSQTEHLSIPLLSKAKKLSELQLVLSGAKAKRTKFQTKHTASLIILAKSSNAVSIYDMESAEDSKPEGFDLESDVLLEKPQYESLEDLELEDDGQSNVKRVKYGDTNEPIDEERLLPIAMRKELIPEELQVLDPNNQPILTDLDNIQLLLRLATIRQTTPSQNPLVEEELMALVSRILYATNDDVKRTNWSIFSRALWERSLLETSKAKTVERGILQMTSLVEEVGINVKLRVIPRAEDEENASPVSSRLRFIHQLPLLPQWTMNAKLAEKYMSLGVIKSAIEIYERLQMVCEAALCYAAIDEEKMAESLLVQRIKTHTQDARAISILGDIKQDPNLWMKAWEISRYSKAKVSLSKYYYSPPTNSGLTKNINLAIQHMYDALTISPLAFENWYFYGCCGLESEQYELASEAFTRCVTLDETSATAWSNLASAFIKQDKLKQSFNALQKAIRSGKEKKSWKIFENYLTVAAKLGDWNEVLFATKELLDIRKNEGEIVIDITIIEKLVEILVATDYPGGNEELRFTHYQTSCIDLICNIIPLRINTSARLWRNVARVELWRKRPWVALECHEKAYRALVQRPELEFEQKAWDDAVEACNDLVAAYESLGELPGKHNAGDVVCQDWKYKARSSVRSLMSKGKAMWEDSEGWNTLQQLKEEVLGR
jgi:tetratricopeptide (TPR) repeat protein